jgi:hypothetical protein
MATLTKALFRGAATLTTTTTLYTVPSATTTVVSNIIVSNTGSSDQTFTLSLAGTLLANAVTLSANSLTSFDIKQVLVATNIIQGGASATAITFHISGVEIS